MALTEDEKLQRLLAEKRHEQLVALLEITGNDIGRIKKG